MSWLWKEGDKRGHFIAGFLIASVVTFMGLFIPLGWAAFLAVVLGTFVGFMKEERDRLDPAHHTEDQRDAAAVFYGAIAGLIIPVVVLLLMGYA